MARPRQVSNETILAAARETFLTEGPSASVRRIAERVGVSQAALFKRFGSKHQLMIAALLPTPPVELIAALNAGPTEDDIPAQLLQHAAALQRHLRTVIPQVWALKASTVPLESLLRQVDELPVEVVRRALAGWFERVEAAGHIRHIDPTALATMLMGSLQGRAMLAHLEGVHLDTATVETWLAQVVDTLWRGISATENV